MKYGELAKPLRAMMDNNTCNAIVYPCKDTKQLENIRIAALVFRGRNPLYKFRTMKRGTELVIYKEEWLEEADELYLSPDRSEIDV